MKRERGADLTRSKAAAAPATVSGKLLRIWPLGDREGVEARRAASQETGRRMTPCFRRWDGKGDAPCHKP